MATARSETFRGAALALICLVGTLGGAAICYFVGRTVNPLGSGPLGLIQALPAEYFLGITLILLSFVFTVRRAELNRPLLVLQLLLLVLVLYGLTSWREGAARLPTGWVHAGFIDYIQRHDSVLANYDARFVWPGFFAFGAMLNELSGVNNSNLYLEWAPLILNLLYTVPVWTIARGAGAPVRTAWLATALFTMLNWVGQDYYSPQGINMLFALSFLAVVMRVFYSHSGVVPPWIRRVGEPILFKISPRRLEQLQRVKLQAASPARLAIAGRQRAALVGALVIVYAACVASHQLTPFFLIVATAALVILDRLQLRVLPVLMFVGVLVWISYAATPFWQGNIKSLFGDVGNVGGVVNQNVSNRVTGDPGHLPVIYGRLALAASLWGAAVLGILRRLRHGRFDLVCLVGFLAPFSILGGQAYGGEAVLRVYLFGLPFAATLAALLLAPAARVWNKKTTALIVVVLLALEPVFFIARYGNEAFEAFTTGEYQLAIKASQLAPDGSKLITVNSYLPWRGERIEHLTFFSTADSLIAPNERQTLMEAMLPPTGQPTLFIANRAQDDYAAIVQGRPAHYSKTLADELVATGKFKVAFRNDQGEIVVPVNQR